MKPIILIPLALCTALLAGDAPPLSATLVGRYTIAAGTVESENIIIKLDTITGQAWRLAPLRSQYRDLQGKFTEYKGLFWSPISENYTQEFTQFQRVMDKVDEMRK